MIAVVTNVANNDFLPACDALFSLFSLYACRERDLQLVKMCANFVLAPVHDWNQSFRGHSCYFWLLKFYRDRVATKYKHEICEKIRTS
jgi:hypothetical protein